MYILLRDTFLNFLAGTGEYIKLISDVLKTIFQKFPKWTLIRDQLFSIGVMSVGVVAITGLSTGVVLAAQSIYQLSSKGLANITGIMVARTMITELGPVLTAFMVTGRVGAAMCAEIGTMKVTEQIDAIRSMAVNPKNYLIAPRFIAGIIMVPLLTIFCILMGILGGYLISTYFFHMSSATYFSPMPLHITRFDIIAGAVKSIIFGILLVTICCYKGMKTKGGAEGVGKATTNSVVISYVSILISDFLITLALNALHLKIKYDWHL
ncbi:MAG: putative phospholipid ABC transporter permease protein MlaE [Candidatus Anoxychlamydiales bacterium]|nr:putative phospholipid ABC transporter permease protein MlaE [Candidatus Anoxychlamydiales bacterium]HEU64972.1 ABC transporter permease [Chlamydiota bacterium]